MKVSSLSRLCIESAADNLAILCRSRTTQHEDDLKAVSRISFNGLSSSLIQELLDAAYYRNILEASHFSLLLHKNIAKLNLSVCNSLVTDDLLKLLKKQCKNLLHLNLSRCSYLSSQCINEVIPSLSSLKSVNLSHCSGCSDQFLRELCSHGSSIRELLLDGCSSITDAGVKDLLSSAQPDQFGCCDIFNLNVSSTSVTTNSFWFILSLLPKLKKLSFAGLKSEEEDPSLLGACLFELEFLDVSGTCISSRNIEILCKRCPNIVEIKINRTDKLGNNFVQTLGYLSQLKSLDIGGVSRELTFEHLIEFLKIQGYQLETLDISGMDGVRISDLCLYCKVLKNLTLADCKNVVVSLPCWEALSGKLSNTGVNKRLEDSRFSDFCQLQYLNLNRVTFSVGSPVILHKFLHVLLSSHCDLKELALKNVPINGETLVKLLKSSSGVNLHTLRLSAYDCITVNTVNEIADICPNLKLLDLAHSWIIDWSDVWNINEHFRKMGKPLHVAVQSGRF